MVEAGAFPRASAGKGEVVLGTPTDLREEGLGTVQSCVLTKPALSHKAAAPSHS